MKAKQIKEIYEGWKNTIAPASFEKALIESVSRERLSICRTCPHHSNNKPNPLRFDEHCTHCGCPLISKTKCLTCACPINKWTFIPPAIPTI